MTGSVLREEPAGDFGWLCFTIAYMALVLGALLAFARGVGPLLLGADFAQDDDNKGS